jgi:hypothetical protein
MKRKSLLAIACVLLVILLVSVYYYYNWYVPQFLGWQYVSVSFRPALIGSDRVEPLHIEYEGKAWNASSLSIKISVINRYFQPVYLSYDGFDVVWLIYNKTVSNPSDVLSNRNFLIWGAYFYRVLNAESYTPGRGFYDFTGEGFEFYTSKRLSSNFQACIPTHPLSNYTLFVPFSEPGTTWYGQYYLNRTSIVVVPPATYFMYCIIYGRLLPPENVTVTSIDQY